MKRPFKILTLLLILSCTSSYEKAILEDQENYRILNQPEFAVVCTPYASLYNKPHLSAKIEHLLKKNTIVRVLFTKIEEKDHTPNNWYYVENLEASDEKGWLVPYEVTLATNIYSARLLVINSKV